MNNTEKNFFIKNAANFITMLNMVFGACSILASINGKFSWAIVLIGFAAISDRYDGAVARKLGTDSPLGVQMDSMGDVISFGIAPAILSYISVFFNLEGNLRILASVVTVIYITAGAFRLARYNVQGLNDDHTFTGLPITAAGSILILFLVFRKKLGPLFYIGLMFILAVLEISKVSIKKR